MTLRALLPFALVALLAACANQPAPGVNPTPQTAPPPPDSAPSTTTTEDSILPTGAPPPSEPDAPVTVEQESPGGTETATPADRNPAREAAVEDCYAYAWSQTANDRQVEGDRAQSFDQSALDQGYRAFTHQLDSYAIERRRGQLFDNCMGSKGYPN